MDMITEIYQDQQHPFCINFAFGLILDNVQRRSDDADDVLQPRYYHGYRNVHVFPTSPAIHSFSSVTKLRKRMESMTFLDDLNQERPDTSWVLALLTNVRFEVTTVMPDVPLGCSDVELPTFLKKKRGLLNPPGRDHLCFFRCLAIQRGARTKKDVTSKAVEYLRQWKGEDCRIREFQGVTLSDFRANSRRSFR